MNEPNQGDNLSHVPTPLEDVLGLVQWASAQHTGLDDTPPDVGDGPALPNGLDDVAEGLALLLDKKVHGEKLVYRIKDTKSLKPKA